MGFGSVVATFFTCILFNMILPSGDIGSDVYLMFNTLTFNLGSGLKLIGCKLCYFKTHNDVYYDEEKFIGKKCHWCVTEKDFVCGIYPYVMERILSFENTDLCEANKTMRHINSWEYTETGECDSRKDKCCLSTFNRHRNTNAIQSLDAKKLFRCFTYHEKKMDYCYVTGSTSFRICMSLKKTTKNFDGLFNKILNQIAASRIKRPLYLFDFIFDNYTVAMKEVDSIENIQKCGFVISPSSRIHQTWNSEYCNEDSCLTHLKSLHASSSVINDLTDWKTNDDHVFGISVGGASCKMLRIYGFSMLFPILLNFFFNISVFKEELKNKKANWFELIPVMMFIYPQFKTLKFLIRYAFIHRDEIQLDYDKEQTERRISYLEPFLESCLQVSQI